MVHVKQKVGLWRSLIDLLYAQKFWMHQISDDFGITPQMAQALHQIPVTESITMKKLAGELWCDASNVTGIVDRLEERGFVERRPAANDRRVKCVGLTTVGKRLRRQIDDRFNESPPAITALSTADQTALAGILGRALTLAQAQRIEREGRDAPGVISLNAKRRLRHEPKAPAAAKVARLR